MRITLLSIALAGCGAAPPHARSDDPEALLACWRDAIGGKARLAAVQSVEREATTEQEGLTGTLHTWWRADGAYREDETEGPASGVLVFDGTHAWERGGLGPVHPLEHTELQQLRTRVFVTGFAPLLGAGHAKLGPAPHTLVLGPDGGRDVTVTLDAATCLPTTLVREFDRHTTTVHFSHWAATGGVQFPGEVDLVTSHGDKEHIAFTATRLDAPAVAFTAPPLDPRTRMPHLATPLAVPAELTQNHVYVEATINGKGPVALLVDTGADGILLDADRARELGLSGTGKVPIRGAGTGQLDSTVVALPKVGLAGTEFAMESAILAPLAALSRHEGRAMQGILGYELFGHYVAEFDYAAPAVRLHDPSTFQPPPGAVAIPFYLYDTKPIIEATFELADGRRFPVQVLVDTGNRASFIVAAAFVKRNKLLDGAGPVLRAPLGFGVGGQTKQALGRIKQIELGGIPVRDVLGSFSEDADGAGAGDEATQANLGSAVMKQFTVWFDYPHQRMYLQKNAHYGEPFDYDASGILLEAPDAAFQRAVVKSILPDSPASAAGVAPGDELLTIDGEPVAKLGLEAIRTRLRVAGRHVRLELAAGGKTRTVELVTRKLI